MEYINGKWTGLCVCRRCYDTNPESSHSAIKNVANIRNGNLDPFSKTGKGFISEQITCKARIVKNLNLENDNFNTPIDHSRDPELGIITSKGAIYDKFERSWTIGTRTEVGKIFDNIIVHCMSNNMKNVERTYIFPWEEVTRRQHTITINTSSVRVAWYEKYRVDEKPYNDAYHNLNEEDLKGLRNVKDFIEYLRTQTKKNIVIYENGEKYAALSAIFD